MRAISILLASAALGAGAVGAALKLEPTAAGSSLYFMRAQVTSLSATSFEPATPNCAIATD